LNFATMTSILSQDEIMDLDSKILALSENASTASENDDPDTKAKNVKPLSEQEVKQL